jgi:endonuclease VIII
VWYTARRMHEALAGSVLTRFDLRVPRHASADLRGHLVREVAPRGKHLLVRIEPGMTLHSHLGMDGSWRLRRNAGRPPGKGAARVRAVLANDAWMAVGSELARLDLVKTDREPDLVGHLGPDLLGPDWDPDEAARRLSTNPSVPIAEAIVDQRNLAGIGNVYQAELLFLRGVHPDTPVSGIGDLGRMVRLAHDLLWTNRLTPMHVTTGDRRPGQRHWVYGRSGEPCRRCRTLVRRGEVGPAGRRRSTYFCPQCQPHVVE